ncbi:arginase family protein [Chryseobacterium sp.]|uniref:arginase family protein n=1 Tax=Chryseobacterium sp. TaxID=1871047 RepID=UPI0025B840C0|nr:arginase family protein [Chryseobacterium sp.]
MKRDVNIFEFPLNLGLTKKDHETEPGVRKLPDWLNKFNFHQEINPKHIFRLNAPPYTIEFDEEAQVNNSDAIIEYAKQQSDLISKYFTPDYFNIILGGDCSILIGNALAMRKKGNFGLFYLDGHTDFILPHLSQSRAIAGMDLAIIAGLGHEKLTNINHLRPYIEEENIFCVGNAETQDQHYVEPIINSKVHYFDLFKLRQNGFYKTAKDFLNMIENKKLDGFLIHLDVDVLKDEIMPAVDSRMEEGIDYPELKETLIPLVSHPECRGIEITILDPNYDQDGICTIPFIHHITEILKSI